VTSTRVVSFGDLTEEQLRVHRAGQALHRDGASPSGALELLAAIVEDRTWERVTDAHGRAFAGRFTEFVEAKSPFGLGYPVAQLKRLLELRHPHEEQGVTRVAEQMAEMRRQVRQLLGEAINQAPPQRHAGPGRGNKTDCDTNGFLPDRVEHVVARLKRDAPELADRVVTGKISANAAAREMGWRHPRVVVSTPQRVAASLRKHMTPDQIAELVELLSEDH
jgi:DNA-binding transcriptional MerR regulator